MTGWLASKVSCFICTHEWVAVYPSDAPEEALECPSCGALDSEIANRIGVSE
jgi:hypothetical protein